MASVENLEPHVDMIASSKAPVGVAVAAEKPPSKPVKEKKAKVPKEKKPKTTAPKKHKALRSLQVCIKEKNAHLIALIPWIQILHGYN
ncbi:hypothetical protein AMTR_s00033p00094640 [Amborella trichopoda]|uniref:Uncharacterized protein n=1 Tax=Amborella trichopoda TaxID=13333 RepID=U5CM49_AMBTC|nr:hypothetical protein AMTR_s00033p00094640 [Amborella trichopoda]